MLSRYESTRKLVESELIASCERAAQQLGIKFNREAMGQASTHLRDIVTEVTTFGLDVWPDHSQDGGAEQAA